MSWLDRLQTDTNLIQTGEVDLIQSKSKNDSENMGFISDIDKLVDKVNAYITNLQQLRQRNFHSFAVTLAAGDYKSISEDFVPDKWFIVMPSTASVSVGVYPSSGIPSFPDMFQLSPSTFSTIPGLSQYLSIKNIGTVSATLYIYSSIGFELDITPTV